MRANRAEGVIFAMPSFCDPALLERPMLQNALKAAGIPYIAFKYAENSGQMQPIREQAGTFAELDQAVERRMSRSLPPAKPPRPRSPKTPRWLKQKEMVNRHYDRLADAPESGEKVAATFVPGNLNELLMCFGFVNNLPEVNAIQNGLRKTSGSFVMEAEKLGHSEDVCTYVKSDIGMMAKGNIGPNGASCPDPDVLLLSYTGCFTFMKWFELLRRAIQLRNDHAAHALSGRRRDHAGHDQIYGQAA